MNSRALVLALVLVAACKNRRLDRSDIQAREQARAELQAQATDRTADDTAATAPDRDAVASEAIPQKLGFTVSDQGFSGPDTVKLGLIEIQLRNTGSAIHELRLLKLPGEATAEQALAFIRERGELPNNLGPQGGAGPILPGHATTVALQVQAGWYLMVSGLPDGRGRPWYLSGVIKPLLVTGRARRLQPPYRAVRGMVNTTDNAWRLGATVQTSPGRTLLLEGRQRRPELPPGEMLLQVEHAGGNGHDFILMRATEPRAMREYAQWIEGQRPRPPEGIISGIPGLFAAMRAWITIDLEAGPYLVFCPNWHPRTQVRGFETGEFSQFIVR